MLEDIIKSKQLLYLMAELDKRGNRIRQAYNLYDSGLINENQLNKLLVKIKTNMPLD